MQGITTSKHICTMLLHFGFPQCQFLARTSWSRAEAKKGGLLFFPGRIQATVEEKKVDTINARAPNPVATDDEKKSVGFDATIIADFSKNYRVPFFASVSDLHDFIQNAGKRMEATGAFFSGVAAIVSVCKFPPMHVGYNFVATGACLQVLTLVFFCLLFMQGGLQMLKQQQLMDMPCVW